MSEDGIPKAEERRVIAYVMRVMEVVVLGRGRKRYQAIRTPRELVATMPVQSLKDTDYHPDHEGAEMHVLTKNHGTNRAWKCGPKNEFNWMRVLCCDSYSSLVGMMQLVDVRVDYSPVQEAVREVKSEIFTEHTEEDVHHEGWGIGQVLHLDAILHFPIC